MSAKPLPISRDEAHVYECVRWYGRRHGCACVVVRMHGCAIHALPREAFGSFNNRPTCEYLILAEAEKILAKGSQVILRHVRMSRDSKYPIVRDLLVRSTMLQSNLVLFSILFGGQLEHRRFLI